MPITSRVFFLVVSLGLGLAAALTITSTPASGQAPRGARRWATVMVNGQEAVAGEVLVKFRSSHAQIQSLDVEQQADADEMEALGGRQLGRVHSRTLDTRALMARLRRHPDLEYAEPNYIIRADLTPNDTQFPNLWGLFNTGQNIGGAGLAGADIDATLAWGISTGSRANVVAVVDTGVDYQHPDLAANVWSAPAPFSVTIGGTIINCAAGTHGFNAILNTCDPMDDNNHGTHVSGTIGAIGNNGTGVAGVNWTASIMGAKFLGSGGSGSTSDAVKAIEFTIQAKSAFAATGGANVRVLSNSWGGGGFSQALSDEINRANSNDMLFVASAGNSARNNDTTPSYPASYQLPNVIAVAATDNNDRLASFSNYGPTSVHLGAPGVNVLSTVRNAGYAYFNGTSMAAPHVSGVAALVLSVCAQTAVDLRTTLLNSVDAIPSLASLTTTGGRLNAYKALQSCGGPLQVSLSANRAAPQPPGTTVTWTATATGGQSPRQFKWWVYDGVTWTTLTGWVTTSTFAWTPSAANSQYVFGVWARSANNTVDAAEASQIVPFAIAQIAATGVVLGADRLSPQPTGITTTWTASPIGGAAPFQYKWWVYDGTTWTSPSGWVAASTFAWTPAAAGSYFVGVWVRSTGNTVDAAESSAIAPFTIAQTRLTAVALTANRVAPQPVGSTITWMASPIGGAAPHEYKWWIYDGVTWTALTGWVTTSTFAWTPGTANSQWVFGVWVRGAGATANAAEASAVIPFAIVSARVTALALGVNRLAPQPPGATITWTALVYGTNAAEYKWWLYDGTTWTTVTGWVSSNTFAWTPTVANTRYIVGVWARAVGNTVDAAEASELGAFPIVQGQITGVTIAPDRAAPQAPGATITWTATPSGTAAAEYKWWLYDGTAWTPISGWVSSNTFAWIPTVANSRYVFGTWARSAGSVIDAPEASAIAGFPIGQAGMTDVSLVPDRFGPQRAGTAITWTAAGSGGVGPYQYKWWLYDGQTWTTLTGWVTSNTLVWVPSVANPNYVFGIWARSAGNTVDAPERTMIQPFPIQP